MQLQDAQEVETTINELISALRETTGEIPARATGRDAYFSSLYAFRTFRQRRSLLSSWH